MTQARETQNPKLKAVFAAEQMYRKAIEAGDEARAKTILEVTALFVPGVRFSARATPAVKPPAKVEATADLTEEDRDERDYREYLERIDGTAIRREQAERQREEEEIRDNYYRENPEARPTDWSPEHGYGG